MAVKNRITDLRNHMFEAIELLLDPESNFDASKGNAIAQLSKQVIESAKVEIQAAKLMGLPDLGTDFIETSTIPYREPEKQLTPKEFDKLG